MWDISAAAAESGNNLGSTLQEGPDTFTIISRPSPGTNMTHAKSLHYIIDLRMCVGFLLGV